MFVLDWFLSKRFRQAVDACRQVDKLIRAQRDILTPEHLDAARQAVAEARATLRKGRSGAALQPAVAALERAAQQHLRPYPHPGWRENIEVFLVTAAIVLALRTFFFQPMAIPSGSAQPTLWGIVVDDLRGRNDVKIPGAVQRFGQKWWSGISYFHVAARAAGRVENIGRPRLVAPFIRRQTITVGGQRYAVYFSSSLEDLFRRREFGLSEGLSFRAGDDILRARVVAGDHLFVNRMIYNFRQPLRGETIVFSSSGIPGIIQDTHYIKRLVAVGGDRVRIGDDRHLVINDQRLDASTPGFENVYSFNPKEPPRDDHYSGHVNGIIGRRYKPGADLAPRFPNEQTTVVIPPNQYLAMGDNTMNSHDGRAWGPFPREKVIGRSSFVFWPITDRFGWGAR